MSLAETDHPSEAAEPEGSEPYVYPWENHPVMTLTARSCRWVYGDPGVSGGWAYCGRPNIGEGEPYCHHHSKEAYPHGSRFARREVVRSANHIWPTPA